MLQIYTTHCKGSWIKANCLPLQASETGLPLQSNLKMEKSYHGSSLFSILCQFNSAVVAVGPLCPILRSADASGFIDTWLLLVLYCTH